MIPFLITIGIILVAVVGAILVMRNIPAKRTDSDKTDPYKRKYDGSNVRNYRYVLLAFSLLLSLTVSSYVLNLKFLPEPELAKLKEKPKLDDEPYDQVINTQQKNPPKPKKKPPVIQEQPQEVIEKVVEIEIPEEQEQEVEEIDVDFDALEEGDGEGEKIEDNQIYYFVEEMAEFDGDLQKIVNEEVDKLLSSHDRRKLENLPRNSIVTVAYVIEKDGSISNIEVLKGVVYSSINDKIVQALYKLPKWKPGKANGYPVRLRYTQNVKLK